MEAILKEQALQRSGCTDTSCAVRFGQLLAADKVLTGTVSRVETKYIFNINIADVEKGEIDSAESGSTATIADLESATKDLSRRDRAHGHCRGSAG